MLDPYPPPSRQRKRDGLNARARKRGGRFLFTGVHEAGGERGIRTLEALLTLTRFPSVRLKPLGHLSASGDSTVIKKKPAEKAAR
jgi:hypothetical protein